MQYKKALLGLELSIFLFYLIHIFQIIYKLFICSLKNRLMSSVIPNNSTSSRQFITLGLIFSFTLLHRFLPRIISWNFQRSDFSEFILNQVKIIFISYFRLSGILGNYVPQLWRVLSSGILHISQFSMITRLLIKTLKSKGPMIDTRSTTFFKSDLKLYKKLIFTRFRDFK